ncbi:MAG: hypothetical protein KF757_11985 [Phycisphaeraceae bacterium]|nr:hypothetical protein [Phycisphaeraceae bacterium]MCW5762412.1 hypothetical protein [Phycisphaeraceae bacterium]
MNRIVALISCVGVITIGGCSTKNHGRMTFLSEAEKRELTCREINLELAKVDAFLDQISENAKIDGRSVLGFLGDFGIGNAMERNAAEKSARERREQLQELKTAKNCP